VTGIWVASYVLLWTLVIFEGLLIAGLLYRTQTSPRTRSTGTAGGDEPPDIADDGPPIGSAVVPLSGDPINGLALPSPSDVRATPGVVVFLSSTCETCQHIVPGINELARRGDLWVVAVMSSNPHACKAFQSIFPVEAPLLCDRNRSVTESYGVLRNPFALLYEDGALVRKGAIRSGAHLRSLMGEPVPGMDADIFPVPNAPVSVGA